MSKIPRVGVFDSTLALLRDPYRYIAKHCRRTRSDIFETRVLFQKTLCMSGAEAAALFYDENRFTRSAAAPQRLQKTLFGQGGVQGLDGDAHRQRKRMLMSLMVPEQIARLRRIIASFWRSYAERWAVMERVELYPEVQKLLMQAVCRWANIPLRDSEIENRTRDMAALFENVGAIGPRHWQARRARQRAEQWLIDIVEKVRTERIKPNVGTALHVIAWHRDDTGQLLDSKIAAVELLNVVRPIVAVSVYILFIAHALQQYPDCRAQYTEARHDKDQGEEYAHCFVQEVRRFYPFFPAVVARVRRHFHWKGYAFAEQTRVVLDLFGTNRDERIWYAPDDFRPRRFRGWNNNAFGLIPQGGGDHYLNHRCAGEWLTIELMKDALQFLARQIRYDVVTQDLALDYTRLPALPKNGFTVRKIILMP